MRKLTINCDSIKLGVIGELVDEGGNLVGEPAIGKEDWVLRRLTERGIRFFCERREKGIVVEGRKAKP